MVGVNCKEDIFSGDVSPMIEPLGVVLEKMRLFGHGPEPTIGVEFADNLSLGVRTVKDLSG